MSEHSRPINSGGYNELMVNPQAAMVVLDHVPSDDEIEELAHYHLNDFPADEAHASCEIVYTPPTWLDIHEQDQFSAHLRDGAACILIIYMAEGADADDDF